MLSIKQGGTKNYFLSFWYNLPWDWTPVSWTINEHSKHFANEPVIVNIEEWNYINMQMQDVIQGYF